MLRFIRWMKTSSSVGSVAVIRSAAMMLEYVGRGEAGGRIERAVMRTLEAGAGLTRDLGGDGNTNTLAEQVIKNLGA